MGGETAFPICLYFSTVESLLLWYEDAVSDSCAAAGRPGVAMSRERLPGDSIIDSDVTEIVSNVELFYQ